MKSAWKTVDEAHEPGTVFMMMKEQYLLSKNGV